MNEEYYFNSCSIGMFKPNWLYRLYNHCMGLSYGFVCVRFSSFDLEMTFPLDIDKPVYKSDFPMTIKCDGLYNAELHSNTAKGMKLPFVMITGYDSNANYVHRAKEAIFCGPLLHARPSWWQRIKNYFKNQKKENKNNAEKK